MSQTLRLFLDSVISSPVSIVSSTRYALINPKHYGGTNDSTLFALVGGFDEELRVPIDGGVLMGDEIIFVLDSLTSDFLLVRDSSKTQDLPFDVGTSRIDIVDISAWK